MVHNPSYLMRSRHGIYYMRYPIPATLHPQGKHDYVRMSLQTYSKQEALILMDRLRYAGRRALMYVQGMRMSFHEIKELLAEHFRACLEKDKKEMSVNGAMKPSEASNDKFFIQTLERYNNSGEVSEIVSNFDNFIELKERFNLSEEDQPLYNNVALAYQHALVAYKKELLALNEKAKNPFSDGFDLDELDISAKQQKSTTKTGYHLTEVIETYFLEHNEVWAPTSMQSYRTYAKALLELVGQDIEIEAFDMTMARKVRDDLSKKKAHISTRTKNEYISFFGSFFKWALNQGYVDTPFFSNMSFKETKTEKSQPKKREYSQAELSLIYEELLKQRESLKPHFFWTTMLGIYTGARQYELCQLWVSDVKKVDGVWTISINLNGDTHNIKKLKTEDSERIIPIHPKLIELGFIDYVNNQDTVRLFPHLSYTPSKQNYSKNVSRWYNGKFIKGLGIKTSEVDYHSLRRSLIDGLIKLDVDEHKVQQIVGHKREGITQLYSKSGYSLSQLYEALCLYKPDSLS